MEPKKRRPTPLWATMVLGTTLLIVMVLLCYVGLCWVAKSHGSAVVLLGLEWPQLKHLQLSCVILFGVMWVVIAWFVLCYEKSGRRLQRILSTMFCTTLIALCAVVVSCKLYANELAWRGIGTMQMALDTEYYQEEMKLMGNLGVYGGQITLDGEAQTYVCRQIDTFGPFAEQLLSDTETQPFSAGYEEYSRFEQDGLMQVHGVSVRYYDDGYWLVVKRFVDVRDLYIELNSLNDLQKYIIQMQYSRHTGSEQDVAREFEEVAGEAVSRTR